MSTTLSAQPERIFIDATYTIGSGKNSGIERVVRNLLRELKNLGQAGRIPEPRLIVSHGGKFFETTAEQVASFQETASMQANVLSTTPAFYRSCATSICGVTGSSKLRKWLLPQPGHLGIFKLWHTLCEAGLLRDLARRNQPIAPTSRDIFLLPDAYWVNRLRNSVWPAAAEARQRGAHIASIIYDLIPLTHPEFVGLKRRDAFRDYLYKAAQHSDILIAISETVRQQLADYLQGALPADTELRSYELGAELSVATGNVRETVRSTFDATAVPYLMVATFDPRKNHRYVLDAFDLLWQSQPELRLCLVGRVGSRCDDLMRRIRQHPRLNQQLFVFDDLSDAELQHCYRQARGVIFPSIVEGFGLPIVEALWFGKKTFVSDTAIHREVGRQDCCYFDLQNPAALADQIVGWESQLASGGSVELPTRRPTSWQQSSEQVLAHLLNTYSSRAA